MLTVPYLIAFISLSFCPALVLSLGDGGYISSCYFNRLSNKEIVSLEDPISNHIDGYGKTIYLNSACATGNDLYYRNTTSLDLGTCIINHDGNLSWLKTGRFQQSCTNCGLNDSAGSVMTCECNVGKGGTKQNSSIDLNDHIANNNGHLTCLTPVGAN